MSEFAIARLRHPDPILNPGPVQDFLLQAAAENHYPEVYAALRFLADEIESPGCGVWLGVENGALACVCIAFWPGNPLMIAPQVCVAYNTGSRALSRAIGEEVVAWAREGGFDRIRILNETGYSDTAHMRAFRYVGDPHLVGSIIEYRLKPEERDLEQSDGRVEIEQLGEQQLQQLLPNDPD